MGAQRFSHSGQRHVLGYGDGFFGIWDRAVAGGPVLSFPRTDDGWHQAWHRFLEMEPQAVEVAAMGGPAVSPAGASAVVRASGVYRPGRTLAGWLVAILALAAAAGLLGIVFRLIYIGVLHRFEANPDSVPFAELKSNIDRVDASNTLVSLALLAVATVWLIWQFRVRTNMGALGATNLRYSPGWNIGLWFIPLANLVMPYLAMREFDRASEPQAGDAARRAARNRWLPPVWWSVSVVTFVLFSVGNGLGEQVGATTADHIARQIVLSIACFGLMLTAGLAALVVRRIDRNQDARRDEAAPPAGSGVTAAPAATATWGSTGA
jgi:hypothetical protein